MKTHPPLGLLVNLNKNLHHPPNYRRPMDVDQILEKYGLTRNTTTAYIDAITRLNQTETAQEIDVSRETINRYKRAFSQMNAQERSQLIASLAQDQLLERATSEE